MKNTAIALFTLLAGLPGTASATTTEDTTDWNLVTDRSGADDEARSVIVDDGVVYYAGYETDTGASPARRDATIRAFDTGGGEYTGGGLPVRVTAGEFEDVCTDPDNPGYHYAVGYKWVSGHGRDWYVAAYKGLDPTPLWSHTADSNSVWPFEEDDVAYSCAVGKEGVFVTGLCQNAVTSTSSSDWCTVQFDPASGAVGWVATFSGNESDRDDVPRAVAVDPDNEFVYVAGEAADLVSHSPHSWQDLAVVSYDLTLGTQLEVWAEDAGGNGGSNTPDETLLGVAVDPAGSPSGYVFVVGEVPDGSGGTDAYYARLDGGGFGSLGLSCEDAFDVGDDDRLEDVAVDAHDHAVSIGTVGTDASQLDVKLWGFDKDCAAVAFGAYGYDAAASAAELDQGHGICAGYDPDDVMVAVSAPSLVSSSPSSGLDWWERRFAY